MRTVYKVLAYLVAVEVAVQAMAMVFAVAGLGKWVDGGGVLDKAVFESEQSPFPEVVGFIVHGINGSMVIPVIALALLVVSFFARIPGGVRWAGFVLLLVAVQITLGFAGHDMPALGALHGLNALALFSTAVYTARRSRRASATSADKAPAAVEIPA